MTDLERLIYFIDSETKEHECNRRCTKIDLRNEESEICKSCIFYNAKTIAKAILEGE